MQVFIRPVIHADLPLEHRPHSVNGLLVWDLAHRPTASGGTYVDASWERGHYG